MRVSTTFRNAGMKSFWSRSDTRNLITCVHDAARRETLARWIKHVVFFNHEIMWPSQIYACPKFPRVSTVQLYGTSLCASGPSALVPFLGTSLRELSIWTQSDDAGQPIRRQGDNVWISHLGTTCAQLRVLNLEATLNTSSAELASLFSATSMLERLRLGYELNPVLGVDSISAIFALPNLEQLIINYPFNADLVQGLLSTELSATMLPTIQKLDIIFDINDSLAAAILLEKIGSLQELSLTFEPTTDDLVAALHPAFFHVIGTLRQLTSLNLYPPATILIPHHGLAKVAAQAKMHHLAISSDKDGYAQSHGHVQLKGHDLLSMPISLKFLEALESLNVASPVQVTYDEATAFMHAVMNVWTTHMHLFHLEADEASSFGWPTIEDWQSSWEQPERAKDALESEELVWKASSKAFAPDPMEWSFRQLNVFKKKNGDVISLEEAATNGAYNYIS